MTGKVFDKNSGMIRVCQRMCDTCIFRPGNLMHLPEGRRDALEADAVASDRWITCHDTLGPAVGGAVCRGFFNRHRMDVWPLRLAAAVARILYVPFSAVRKGDSVDQVE